MARKKPEIDPPPVKKWDEGKQERVIDGEKIHIHTIGNTEVIVQTRQYKLITPLFGGGVEPGVNDLDNLIRATEIRGQLRFWWRAIRGGQFDGDLTKMKEREDEIWGAASKKNALEESHEDENQSSLERRKWKEPVQIVINKCWQDEEAQKEIVLPAYAAFPLTDQDGSMQKQTITSAHEGIALGVHFELSIMYPIIPKDAKDQAKNLVDMELEVKAALWAWETFGGIGARTRRGFGALELEKVNGNAEKINLPFASVSDAETWLSGKLKDWVQENNYPANVPHLSTGMPVRVIGLANTPIFVWKNIIKKLQEFRQSPYGRDKRSKWPEAEAIRKITGYRFYKLRQLDHPQKFPRAAFGLPIVFHFKDENKKEPLKKDYDPPEMTLQSANDGQERWASPLILKPLICRNGQALGLACILQGSQLPEQMRLKPKDERVQPHDVNISQTRLTTNEAASLPVQGQPDVLQAFLSFLKQ